nr:reverse transcriptase domain-containing protein [Tanacetum cinerariifolium]
MADNRTMEELLQAPTEWYGEAIIIPEINVDYIEMKTNLLQLVQTNPCHGFVKENSHTHINNVKRITLSLKFRDMPNDVIKLIMFPYSLEGFRKSLAWERFKEIIRAFPHHRFIELAQIDTAARGNLLSKTTREALQIIENKSKVRYSRDKPNVSRMNTNSKENDSKMDDRIDKLANEILTLVDIFAKKVVTPAPVKAVKESCGEMKAITTQSSVASEGPSIPTLKKVVERETEETTDKEQTNFQGTTKQMEKFFQVFQDLHFDVSFADALLLMPKFSSTIKSLLTNKDKLFELAKIPFNENYSAMLLKNLLKNLGDLGKFLIPRDFPGMDEYAQEIFGFSNNSPGGNPTSTSEPILSDSSPSLTSFEGSNFILEEIEAYLKDESISSKIDHADCDLEGEICLIEKLLNNDSFQLTLMDLKQGEVVKAKSLIEEPSELELKYLPSHLEYA